VARRCAESSSGSLEVCAGKLDRQRIYNPIDPCAFGQLTPGSVHSKRLDRLANAKYLSAV
jgi:hypothetical protein